MTGDDADHFIHPSYIMQPTRRHWIRSALALIFAAAPIARLLAQPAAPTPDSEYVLTAAADRKDATYRPGETATFNIRLHRRGEPIDQAEVAWTLTKDGVPPTKSGRVALRGGVATITGTLSEPGFLQCRVTLDRAGVTRLAVAGAAFAPLAIKPSQPAPADFDAFWAAQKARLAAVPMNARLTPVKSPSTTVEVFDLQADSVGAPVSAYFARPVGAKPKSLPAIMTAHGAGVNGSSLSGPADWASQGALALDLNAHGLPNGKPKEFYAELSAGRLNGYSRSGRESRDTIYFLGMYLRLIRAIDFLTAQPEWDGRTVVVSGSSQGGAQAIAAAGLDPRVSFFAAGVPAMCDHTGILAGRVNGWPKFIPTDTTGQPPAEVVMAVRYYDAVNFAARARASACFTVGFIDTTCPPTTVYAAYNAIRNPKEIFDDIGARHTNTPEARAFMRAAILRHFATR